MNADLTFDQKGGAFHITFFSLLNMTREAADVSRISPLRGITSTVGPRVVWNPFSSETVTGPETHIPPLAFIRNKTAALPTIIIEHKNARPAGGSRSAKKDYSRRTFFIEHLELWYRAIARRVRSGNTHS